jgi:hypothetical protein
VRGFRTIGLLLVAIAWLQVNLRGRAVGSHFPRAGGDRISAAATCATQAPQAAVHFHQLRLAGATCWFGKCVDWPVSLPEEPLVQTIPGPKNIWPVAAAPDELRKTWQFTRRAALRPRAPCEV